MAKLAVEVERALARRALTGAPGRAMPRLLARGDGWMATDVVCTSGPQDRRFEERHSSVSIAIVVSGSFEYGAGRNRELMTPGSILLGSPGQGFECGHEHGAGDRCVSFHYAPEYFDELAVDAGARGGRARFRALRLPPVRALAPLIARACTGLTGSVPAPWEELGVRLAARTLRILGRLTPVAGAASPSAVARVTRSVRMIERQPEAALALGRLAREAGLSPYHFLRTFRRLTGATPHQYVLRTRLREAAISLSAEPGRILDVAFDSGFGDVSNFNHAFRDEFGVSPRVYRSQVAGRG